MTPPRKVRVSPFTLAVQQVRGLADAGQCSTDQEAILLELNQADNQKRDTLIHEALHAMLRQGMGTQLKAVDKDFEETLVEFLAPRLLALLRDNPGLIDYLVE